MVCSNRTTGTLIAMNAIIFLQNAWSPRYAGKTWPRISWLRALEASRSGKRLKVLTDDLTICHNTTPKIAKVSSGFIPPDELHIREILNNRNPDIVIACGKSAEDVLKRLWEGPLLAIPHPASRLLTNALYEYARNMLYCNVRLRLALRQKKGYFYIEKL